MLWSVTIQSFAKKEVVLHRSGGLNYVEMVSWLQDVLVTLIRQGTLWVSKKRKKYNLQRLQFYFIAIFFFLLVSLFTIPNQSYLWEQLTKKHNWEMLVINFELWIILETPTEEKAISQPILSQPEPRPTAPCRERKSMSLPFFLNRSLFGVEIAGIYQNHLPALLHQKIKLSFKDLLDSKANQLFEGEKLKKLEMWLALLIRAWHWGDHKLLITALCGPICWCNRVGKQIKQNSFLLVH